MLSTSKRSLPGPGPALLAVILPVVLAVGTACGGGEDVSAGLPELPEDATATADQTEAAPGAGQVAAGAVDRDTNGDGELEPGEVEVALLEFSECMRGNGFAEFPDPVLDADDSVRYDPSELLDLGIDLQSEVFRSAIEECQPLIQGLALGGGQADTAEMQDSLLALAECMRENGVPDFPDPDLSALGSGQGPFRGELDLDDPAMGSAFEVCQDTVNLGGLAGGGDQ
ncbi:MAG: hypothetical protein M9922_08265 [Microthrixaceae bacterium]|nr:hypothetical protein [Microthrixaceae bacterium]